MRLALVIGSLGGGGAERVMATLANAWVHRGVSVTLITIAGTENDVYPLDPLVQRIALGLNGPAVHWWQGLANNRRRVRALREVLREANPDGVLSFMTSTNVLSVLAVRPLRIPVIVAERISPAHHRLPIVWRGARRYAYRRASAVAIQTECGAAWLRQRISGVPVRVIPNPVQVDIDETLDTTAQAVVDACRGRNVLLAVGRLSAQKGYDILLRAFVSVAYSHPSWRLVILGDGPERDRIEALVRELELADRVLLPGFSNTPHALMRRAQVFVMSSRYEGFPGALLEAMACGLPCVSFDCPTGPSELIEHGTNGLLVPAGDVAALAGVLAIVMGDAALRTGLGTAARAVRHRFALEAVLTKWEDLFVQVLGDRGASGLRHESLRSDGSL